LFYRRSLREIAVLLGCEPSEDAILARREGLGLEKLTDVCFRAAGLEAVLLDDGFLPGEILPVEWHGRFAPAYRVLRLEALAQGLRTADEGFATFLERFRAALDPPPPGVVALKSIAAYRTGLAVEPVPRAAAEARFAAWQRSAGTGTPRLADKALV